MEKRKISGKWIGIIAAAAVVLVSVIVVLVIHFTGSDDSYRSIQIYELEGKVSIERENMGTIEAVENLYLESGDWIRVPKGSYMRLKLDDDKYILVEEDSVLSIVAEGTKEDSKTSIQLEQGAIVNEIQNKLSKDSSYEVNTPNSVMAARGTVFRVEVTIDENGEMYTKVSTFEGKVASWLIMPDGTRVEDAVMVKGGKEVIIHMDVEKTEYISDPQDIDYEALTITCLEFLADVMEHGTVLAGIDPEEIKTLIIKLKQEDEETENEPGASPTVSAEPDAEPSGEPDAETSSEPDVETSSEPDAETDSESSVEPGEAASAKPSVKASAKPSVKASAKPGTKPSAVPSGGTQKPTNGADSEQTETPKQSDEPVMCKVTFVYNGTVFATQEVEAGQRAVVPKLAPAKTGTWDFDFSTVITGDVTVQWK